MFAAIYRTRVKRRGVILVVVLGMLGLLALIGVTFATFSNQAQINSRNFSQSMSFPDAGEMMDYALSQLIDDTANPQSVIRGHSLKRDMYGNDARTNGALLYGRPDGSGPITILGGTSAPTFITTGVHAGLIKCLTDIPADNSASPDPSFYSYNFQRWVIKFPATTNTSTTPPTYFVSRTLEILVDDRLDSSGYRAFYVAPPRDGSEIPAGTTKRPGADPSITNYQPLATGTNWQSTLSSGSGGAAIPTGVPLILDGRFLRAFNGPGITGMGSDGFTHPLTEYANWRYNGNIFANTIFAGNPGYTPAYGPAYGTPDNAAVSGMDEDYDAADLENWFLSLQSADGQVVIPSFHRPGIVTALDWTRQYDSTATAALQAAATRAMSKILRPRQIDGHSPLSFPDLVPDATTGKITYDVDNDGDGVTDAVWLDLGYAPKRNPGGQLFKPLFAFTVIGLNGKMPLNTAGNLSNRIPVPPGGGGPATLRYEHDHAEHLGTSPSELDIRFALQNAYDANPSIYSRTDNAGINTAGSFFLGTFTPGDKGVSVGLTQLRNLLMGTRPFSSNIGLAANDDSNYVIVNGQAQYLPNGMTDAGDYQPPNTAPVGTTLPIGPVYSRTPPVGGRWGEEDFVPTYHDQLPSGATFLSFTNRVRAGLSVTTSATAANGGAASHDAMDDNFTTFDVWGLPAGMTVPGTYPDAGEYADYYDESGSISLPVERIRRFVTPADLGHDGRVVTFNGGVSGAGPGPRQRGGDVYGRVSFFKYFRPPGVPLPSTSTLSPTQPAPIFAGNAPSLTDRSNNIYHAFKSFNNPSATNGIAGGLQAGGMPGSDAVGATTVNSGGTAMPSYREGINSLPFFANASQNDPDEMNLYTPSRFDGPFGPTDLEWLYRLQDTDGASLYSRLGQLAPVSFLNPRDGLRRRRLFSIDTWDTTNFVWANDNPSGAFSNNSRFTQTASASFLNLNNTGNNVTPSPDPAIDFSIQSQAPTSYNKYPVPTPSVAHRDRRINLNFPLPVSNSPVEPVRQKWVRETYQFLKATLPPKSIDTPEELAQLSQFLVNVIDFRDPDCTMTKFVNTDVVVTEPLTGTSQAILSHAKNPTNAASLDPSDVYDPNYTFLVGAPTHFLVQHGMEYPPVVINEVLATRFEVNITGPGSPPAGPPASTVADPNYTTAFFIELVNTLTKDASPAVPDLSDMDLTGWDVVIMPDDGLGRPDPFTGQIPEQAAANIVPYSIDGSAPEADIPPATAVGLTTLPIPGLLSTAPSTTSPNYFYVLGGVSKLSVNTTMITPPSTASGGATLAVSPLATKVAALPENTYYWLYLRRPPNPFDPTFKAASPNDNRVVVDCFRFVYTTAKGTASTDTSSGDKVAKQGTPPAGDKIFSIERMQPYRGGHAVPPLTGVSGPYVSTAYGFSEQTAVARNGAATKGIYQEKKSDGTLTQVDTTTLINHTLGGARNVYGDPSDAWDYLPFNDRDFTGVIELAMVPSCPPGLFTKQFAEVRPPIAGTTPVAPPLKADTSWNASQVWTSNPAGWAPTQFTSGGAPHPFPYLNDEFFYSAATESTWPAPPTGPTPYISPSPGLHYIGGPSGAGWYKMFEFFEVPSPGFGAIANVALGTNYDWYRQDLRAGLVNLNLVIDEEVFIGILGESLYGDPFRNTRGAVCDVQLGQASAAAIETPRVVTQVNDLGVPTAYYNMPNVGVYDVFTDPAPMSTPIEGNAMKACFADFLKLRAGGSGYVFGYGRDATGAYGQTDTGGNVRGLASERPFHSLSYPDIDYTILRPATLPPSGLTTPVDFANNPSNTNKPNLPPFLVPYGTPTLTPPFAQDPGVKNPYLYTANAPIQPPPIPTRRLFQIPDWWGSDPTAMPAQVPPSNAGETVAATLTTGDPYVNSQTYEDVTTVPAGLLLYNLKMDLSRPSQRNYLGGDNGGGGPNDQSDHPYFRTEWLQKMANLTTVRTHQYAVWITVGFFEVTRSGDPQFATVNYTRAYDTLGLELGVLSGNNIRYRGFFIIDRTRAVGFDPSLPGDFRDAITYRQLIE